MIKKEMVLWWWHCYFTINFCYSLWRST